MPLDIWAVQWTEYAQFKEDACRQPVIPTTPNTTSPYALTAIEQTNLAAGVNTDWQDLLLTTGIRTSHDLNVRGGNDRTQFYFGVGYYRETGVIHDQVLNRYSFNVNIDHKILNVLKLDLQVSILCFVQTGLEPMLMDQATRLGPLFKPYNDDGTT